MEKIETKKVFSFTIEGNSRNCFLSARNSKEEKEADIKSKKLRYKQIPKERLSKHLKDPVNKGSNHIRRLITEDC